MMYGILIGSWQEVVMAGLITVQKGGEGYYEEKKSRFLAVVYSVGSEEEAASHIEALRKKYWDARHNCYAFVIGNNNEVTRCSDDGEPSGTAGKPILEVITRAGIHNCLVVVTRYFGGTLLGTGGLVRAYTAAAKDALESSQLVMLVPGTGYIITAAYTDEGRIRRAIPEFDGVIEGVSYAADVTFRVHIKSEYNASFVTRITEITGGRTVPVEDGALPVEIPYTMG